MIDIIMAVYNGASYIREQIDSILNNEYRDVRLLVFDDGSNDETADIVGEYLSREQGRVLYFKNEKRYGHCANFLQGLLRARDEYPADHYMFSDQDDVWMSDKISQCNARISLMEAENGKDRPCLVFTDAMLVDKDLNPTGKTFFGADRLDPARTDLAHLLMENKCLGCTMMINDALAEMVSSFDDRVRYHDWWIALIAASFGSISFIGTPTLLYRQHGGNVVGQENFSGYVLGRLKSGKKDARERLKATYRQAAAFYSCYGRKLPKDRRKLVHDFLCIPKLKKAQRRLLIIRNGYLKSGMIRNAGLLMYI